MNPFLLGEAPSMSLQLNPAAVQARLHRGPALGYFSLKEAPVDDGNLEGDFGLARLDEGPAVGFRHSLDDSS